MLYYADTFLLTLRPRLGLRLTTYSLILGLMKSAGFLPVALAISIARGMLVVNFCPFLSCQINARVGVFLVSSVFILELSILSYTIVVKGIVIIKCTVVYRHDVNHCIQRGGESIAENGTQD